VSDEKTEHYNLPLNMQIFIIHFVFRGQPANFFFFKIRQKAAG
jgi:hypothetical protein